MILPCFPAFPATLGARRDMSWTGQAALSADPGKVPVSGLADRFGRRMLLLVTVGAGLALTALAAASPGYW